MPAVPVTDGEARDIAAWLQSLRDYRRSAFRRWRVAACRLRSGGSLFGTGDDLGLGAGPRWRPRVHDCDRGAVDRAARLAAAASPPWRREGDLDARLRLPGGRADRPPHLGAHADLVTVGDAGDRRRK